MNNKNATDVHMQFDASEVKEGGNQVAEMLTGLEAIATNLCESVSNAFQKVTDSMKNVADGTSSIVDSLGLVVEKINEIIALMQTDQIETWLDSFSSDIDVLSAILGTASIGAEIGRAIGGNVGAAIGAGVGALLGLIIVLIIKNWDTIKAFLVSALEWIKTNIIQPAMNLVHKYIVFLQSLIRFVQNLFTAFTEFFRNAFVTDWTEQFGAFGSVLNAFFHNIESIWNAVKRIFDGILGYVKGVFSGDWEAVWESVVEVFSGIWDGMVACLRSPINGFLSLINAMIYSVVDRLNAVIDMINKLRFNIPDWVPEIGGTTFGFNIAPIQTSPIPYLAQGAVLPANKPFLAMVGDQKHGTNVEAPLATIQEALANVLAQQGMGGDIHITFTGDLAQLGWGDLSVLGSIGWRKPGFPKADS